MTDDRIVCHTCGFPTSWREATWHEGHQHCLACTHWRWVDEHDAAHKGQSDAW